MVGLCLTCGSYASRTCYFRHRPAVLICALILEISSCRAPTVNKFDVRDEMIDATHRQLVTRHSVPGSRHDLGFWYGFNQVLRGLAEGSGFVLNLPFKPDYKVRSVFLCMRHKLELIVPVRRELYILLRSKDYALG